MSEAWIAKTQEQLGAVLPAPKLTDKLLSRPPFRFLHDIVTNFLKANGFPEGYFTEHELDSAKVASKEEKLAFITKAIAVVEAAAGKPTSAKPAKILAGAEAENTNEFLQMLATCAALTAAQKQAAVRKALGGGGGAVEPPAPPLQPQPAQPPTVAREQPPPAPVKAPSPPPAEAPPPPPSTQPAQPAQPAPKDTQPSQPQPLAPQPHPVERPGTATARKPPPPTKSNEVAGGHPAEAPAATAPVIIERRGRGRGGEEEEDEEGAQERDWMKVAEEQVDPRHRPGGSGGGATDDAQAKGYLGKQALEAKRAQEEAQRAQEEAQRQAGGGGSDGGIVLNVKSRGKDRHGGAMGETEMGRLREQLQLLTKASNPLGKFLEAIHEDMDTMARELEMWRTEARTQLAAAQEAQRQTDESLHSINSQLQTMEASISDQQLKINIARATILQNDKTIETMLRMVINPELAKKK